jgi:plasmid stabilization system protein ParE
MAYRLAKRAEADLEDIAYYIAKESGSLETARRVIESITDRFHLLGANPYAGRARDDDLGPGRRSFSGRPIYHRLPRLRAGRAYPARGTQQPGHRIERGKRRSARAAPIRDRCDPP